MAVFFVEEIIIEFDTYQQIFIIYVSITSEVAHFSKIGGEPWHTLRLKN